jgi:hypothetical protein
MTIITVFPIQALILIPLGEWRQWLNDATKLKNPSCCAVNRGG